MCSCKMCSYGHKLCALYELKDELYSKGCEYTKLGQPELAKKTFSELTKTLRKIVKLNFKLDKEKLNKEKEQIIAAIYKAMNNKQYKRAAKLFNQYGYKLSEIVDLEKEYKNAH